MRNGFDLAVIQQKRGFDQRFPVTGGTGADDTGALRKKGIDLLNGGDCRFQRTAVIVAVK